MTYKETEILIQKYLNAETSPEEERQLALEVTRDDAPEEWKIIAEMLGELTTDEALYDQIMEERKASEKPKLSRKIWPWLIAACVAGIIALILAPPKQNDSPITTPQIVQHPVKNIDSTQVQPKEELIAQEAPKKQFEAEKETKEKKEQPSVNSTQKKSVTNPEIIRAEDTSLLAENSTESSTNVEEKASKETDHLIAQKEAPVRTLTERDIPITRPENLKYTKEELALMKKQANEAYLKWVELELEIAKYNLEQTAENK